MSEPGWYPDYEDGSQLRYHDGAQWTAHVHPVVDGGSSVEQTEQTDHTVAEPSLHPAPPGKQEAPWVRFLSVAFLGAFSGLLVGGLLFNALGAITPVTETTGTIRNIEIEFSSGSNSTNRRTHVISGTTVDGEDWRIVNEDAYNVVQSEGYPQPVALAIGDWTGTPERVTGASFEVDHQTTGARVGWGSLLLVAGAGAVLASVLISRNDNGGVLAGATFALFLLGPGVWLGFQAFQWFQSG